MLRSNIHVTILLSLCGLLFCSCVSEGDQGTAEDSFGVKKFPTAAVTPEVEETPEPEATTTPTPTPTPTPTDAGDTAFNLLQKKYVRIISTGAGAGTNINDQSLIVGDSLGLRAALFDVNQNYLEDIAVVWSLSGTDISTSSFSSTGPATTTTLTPTTPGITIVQATYIGEDSAIIAKSDTTGIITVASTQIVDSMLIVAGDGQTGTVNNNLSTALKVRVLDTFNLPAVGKSVVFSVTQGSGAIIGSNPVTTDANGEASVFVKLGTVSGSANNKYRAASVDDGSIYSDFTATAVPGPQDHITFTTQPNLIFANAPFGVQPSVELRDAYNNLITSSGNITMSVQTGTGAVTGTATVTMTNGLASWSNIGYNTAEAGVVLRASNGTVTGDTAAFVAGSAPPGACITNDVKFQTAGGGCKDLTSGLVWSNKTAAPISWGRAVWDIKKVGSAGSDVNDHGKTNDYGDDVTWSSQYDCNDFNGSSTAFRYCDFDILAYCHSLTEGAQNDWRMPTEIELLTVYSNMAAGAGVTNYLQSVISENIWTGNMHPSWQKRVVNLFTGVPAETDARNWVTLNVFCVREDENASPDIAGISVLSAPIVLGVNQTPIDRLDVQLIDGNGDPVNAEDVTITLSNTSLGTLGGTLSATTNRRGVALFNAFTLDTAGSNVDITISSTGLNDTTFTVDVGAERHSCLVEDAFFTTADGGCQDINSGLTWSAPAPFLMNWHAAIKGPDEYAGGNFGATPDNDAGNAYCNLLSEGAVSGGGPYTDWRLPTSAEMVNVVNGGTGSTTHFGYLIPSSRYNSATSGAGGSTSQISVNLSTGSTNASEGKTGLLNTICVRP